MLRLKTWHRGPHHNVMFSGIDIYGKPHLAPAAIATALGTQCGIYKRVFKQPIHRLPQRHKFAGRIIARQSSHENLHISYCLTLMLTALGLAASALGRVRVSTPCSNSALALSAVTARGKIKRR